MREFSGHCRRHCLTTASLPQIGRYLHCCKGVAARWCDAGYMDRISQFHGSTDCGLSADRCCVRSCGHSAGVLHPETPPCTTHHDSSRHMRPEAPHHMTISPPRNFMCFVAYRVLHQTLDAAVQNVVEVLITIQRQGPTMLSFRFSTVHSS